MSKIATGYIALKADAKDLRRDLSGAERDFSGATSRMQASANKTGLAFKAMWVAAAAGAAAAIISIKKAVELANAQELAEKKLEAVVKATGEAAGYSAEQMIDMAQALQRVTTYGDETIIEMQAMLATFKQIRGEAFERTTAAVLDMATVMGTDLRSAAIQVAKALNDPVANLGALGRAGVQFTASQKELIKTLWQTGETAKAQDIILTELESQFGGTAKAAADTFGGAVKQLGNVWSDALEDIGEGITKNEDLIDTIHGVRDSILDLIERGDLNTWLTGVAEGMTELINLTSDLISLMGKLYDIAHKMTRIIWPEKTLTWWQRYRTAVQNVLDVLRGVRDAQTGALKSIEAMGGPIGPTTGPYAMKVPKAPTVEPPKPPPPPGEDPAVKAHQRAVEAIALADAKAKEDLKQAQIKHDMAMQAFRENNNILAIRTANEYYEAYNTLKDKQLELDKSYSETVTQLYGTQTQRIINSMTGGLGLYSAFKDQQLESDKSYTQSVMELYDAQFQYPKDLMVSELESYAAAKDRKLEIDKSYIQEVKNLYNEKLQYAKDSTNAELIDWEAFKNQQLQLGISYDQALTQLYDMKYERARNSMIAELDATDEQFRTQHEMLNAYLEMGRISHEEYYDYLNQMAETHYQKQQSYMQAWGTFFLTTLGQIKIKSIPIQLAILAAQTAIQYGMAVASALAAANLAIATIPPPEGEVVAAARLAWGMANANAILAQAAGTAAGIAINAAQGGAGITAGGGTTVGGATVTTPEFGAEQPPRVINIHFDGGVITDKNFLEDLAEKLSELVEGDEVRLISSDMRAT